MITTTEAEQIGFVQHEKGFHPIAHSINIDDFNLYMSDGKLKLCEWEREEDIDISHLNIEEVKTLISLLTKSK